MAEESEDSVKIALEVCGATDDQITAIVAEGFEDMRDLLILDDKEIADMMAGITKFPVNRGGRRIGAILTKKCRALAYWCQEQERQGLDLDANQFTEEELEGVLERMGIEANTEESKLEPLAKFKAHKWESWSKKFENYLWQAKGCIKTPLIYIVRKARTPTSPPFRTTDEERVYMTAHRGAAYTEDNKTVWMLLTQILLGTGAWTWICQCENTKNGKGAYDALRNHYDGPGQIEKRLGYARNLLANTVYRSEKQYSFESYVIQNYPKHSRF
jgi:hypothetical protein